MWVQLNQLNQVNQLNRLNLKETRTRPICNTNDSIDAIGPTIKLKEKNKIVQIQLIQVIQAIQLIQVGPS